MINSDALLCRFRDTKVARRFLERIALCKDQFTLMEVCGTHTVAIFKTGISSFLPANIRLVSGPGCPVCVTTRRSIEKALYLSSRRDCVLFCFGDMFRVPGNKHSLESLKATGAGRAKVIYSPLEALEYALLNPAKKAVLLGVGFETTIPLFASLLLKAQKTGVRNLYLLSAFKLVPPALRAIMDMEGVSLDGFLLPGHVSSVIGRNAYIFLSEQYRMPGVITGFDLVDIAEGIYLLLDMLKINKPEIKTQYTRFVSSRGNIKAQKVIYSVFQQCDADWRGLGSIPQSGLQLSPEFSLFDAESLIDVEIKDAPDPAGCRCSEVILGRIRPFECSLFASSCTPLTPVGPCMVSSEGTCAAYYKYGKSQKGERQGLWKR